jgi:hypothetical protein
MATFGDPNARGSRIKDKAPALGYLGGAGLMAGGASQLNAMSRTVVRSGQSAKTTRQFNRGMAGLGLGAATIGATAGRKKLALVASDFRGRNRPERNRSSALSFEHVPGSVRTRNTSVAMAGSLNASDEAKAKAKDWGDMEARASAAMERNRRNLMTAADRRREERS